MIFDGGLLAAAHWPAPQFVIGVTLLVSVSTGGFPVPIVATILLAGALTTRMPMGNLVFLVLWLSLTVVMSGRDTLTIMLSTQGWRWLQRRAARRQSANRGIPLPIVRRCLIRQSAQRAPALLAMALLLARRRPHERVVPALQYLFARWGGAVLALSRLTPLASPIDIAIGALNIPLRIYVPSITLGRLLFVLLWLGAGALSGQAWQRGATTPELATIITVVVLALVVVPSLLSRRWLAMARI